MKNFRFAVLVFLSLTMCGFLWAASETYTLYEENFEGFEPGNFLGQGGTEIMYSTNRGAGDPPVSGELKIVVDELQGNCLYVMRYGAPEGIVSNRYDRGVRIPLNWSGVNYENGLDGLIVIKGRVKVPSTGLAGGNGYAEIRLAGDHGDGRDFPCFRFTPSSSDYQTYFYATQYRSSYYSQSLNAGETRVVSSERLTYLRDQAVKFDTWCDFEIRIDTEIGQVFYYHIEDGDAFSFTGTNRVQVAMNQAPTYVEFTAVGNGYAADRDGAYYDDLSITFEKNLVDRYSIFYDDFADYTIGDSLSIANPDYVRIGDCEQYTDLISENEEGDIFAKLWINKPEEYPKDGIKVNLADKITSDVSDIYFTIDAFVPDNGFWSKIYNTDGEVMSTYGIHTATRWFVNWDGSDAENLYSTPDGAGTKRWFKITQHISREGDSWVLKATRASTPSVENDLFSWGMNWHELYGAKLNGEPGEFALQLQGWNNFDGRYVYLRGFDVSVVVPEPVLVSLFSLVALLFLRRR